MQLPKLVGPPCSEDELTDWRRPSDGAFHKTAGPPCKKVPSLPEECDSPSSLLLATLLSMTVGWVSNLLPASPLLLASGERSNQQDDQDATDFGSLVGMHDIVLSLRAQRMRTKKKKKKEEEMVHDEDLAGHRSNRSAEGRPGWARWKNKASTTDNDVIEP